MIKNIKIKSSINFYIDHKLMMYLLTIKILRKFFIQMNKYLIMKQYKITNNLLYKNLMKHIG